MHNESLALARHSEEMRDALETRSLQLEEQARRQDQDRYSLVSERAEVLRDRAEAIRIERGVKRQHESQMDLGGEEVEALCYDSAYLDKLISSVMNATATTPSRTRGSSGMSRAWGGGGGSSRDGSGLFSPTTRRWGSNTTPAALGQWPTTPTTTCTSTTTTPNKALPHPTAIPVALAPQAADPNLSMVLKSQAKTKQLLQEHDDFLATCSSSPLRTPSSSKGYTQAQTPSVA